MYLPQNIVRKVKDDSYGLKYTHFIKCDIIEFFPSIKHDDLLLRIRKYLRNKTVLKLIQMALEMPSVQLSSVSDQKNNKGIPQGLAISNILASIYLINFDRVMSKIPNIAYYRYVDDILILCNDTNLDSIVKKIPAELNKLGLQPHPFPSEKSKHGLITDGFQYLGYHLTKNKTIVKESSINNLRSSIISIFTGTLKSQKPNINFLVWKLNLRITGCISEKKRKGWLFYFSEIDDEGILHSLDFFVSNLVKRFKLNIVLKKFVRAYYQIKHEQNTTNYIPNFDQYSLNQKKETLEKIFNVKTLNLSENEIYTSFNHKISYQIKDLLTDIKTLS